MPEFLAPLDQPLSIASAVLQTKNLNLLKTFYESVIGLQTLSANGEEVQLGVEGRRLLTLRQDLALKPNNPRAAGLFHLAFLLPDRAELARWLRSAHLQSARIDGASDHAVSEAIYLSDPDGNGVEMYRDRPLDEWPMRADGEVAMTTEFLDLQALLKKAADLSEPRYLAPPRTVLGHVHLQAGELAPSAKFFEDLGFAKMAAYPGALFYGSGGYHHHLAINTWRSRGAGRRPDGLAGLAELRLKSAGVKTLEELDAPTGLTTIIEPA